jgi:hypothetical protein
MAGLVHTYSFEEVVFTGRMGITYGRHGEVIEGWCVVPDLQLVEENAGTFPLEHGRDDEGV